MAGNMEIMVVGVPRAKKLHACGRPLVRRRRVARGASPATIHVNPGTIHTHQSLRVAEEAPYPKHVIACAASLKMQRCSNHFDDSLLLTCQ